MMWNKITPTARELYERRRELVSADVELPGWETASETVRTAFQTIADAWPSFASLLAALGLVGCGGVSQYRAYEASEHLHASAAAYRACLAAGHECVREREVYEVDLTAYRARSASRPATVRVLD